MHSPMPISIAFILLLGSACIRGELWKDASLAQQLGLALGPVRVRAEGKWHSSDDGSLSVSSTSSSSGKDALGTFNAVSTIWTRGPTLRDAAAQIHADPRICI